MRMFMDMFMSIYDKLMMVYDYLFPLSDEDWNQMAIDNYFDGRLSEEEVNNFDSNDDYIKRTNHTDTIIA